MSHKWKEGDRLSLTAEGIVTGHRDNAVSVLFDGVPSGWSNTIHASMMEKATYIPPPFVPEKNDFVSFERRGSGILYGVVYFVEDDNDISVRHTSGSSFVSREELTLITRPTPQ